MIIWYTLFCVLLCASKEKLLFHLSLLFIFLLSCSLLSLCFNELCVDVRLNFIVFLLAIDEIFCVILKYLMKHIKIVQLICSFVLLNFSFFYYFIVVFIDILFVFVEQ